MTRKRRPARDPAAFDIPPEMLAKLFEVASLMLVAEAIKKAMREGRSMVIHFPKEGEPSATILPPTITPEGA